MAPVRGSGSSGIVPRWPALQTEPETGHWGSARQRAWACRFIGAIWDGEGIFAAMANNAKAARRMDIQAALNAARFGGRWQRKAVQSHLQFGVWPLTSMTGPTIVQAPPSAS